MFQIKERDKAQFEPYPLFFLLWFASMINDVANSHPFINAFFAKQL